MTTRTNRDNVLCDHHLNNTNIHYFTISI